MKQSHATDRHDRGPRREAAQVLVLFALMLPVLVGGVGLMVDLALISRTHARLDAVAASAARAGAQQVSSIVLATTDTFVLSADAAQAAAQQVCLAYKEDSVPDLTCSVEVNPERTDVSDWSPPAQAAWWWYLLIDPTRRYPGYTVHGSVTVTASQNVRLFFLPVLTHQRDMQVAAHQMATPVTGV